MPRRAEYGQWPPVLIVASRLLISRRFGASAWPAIGAALQRLAHGLHWASARLLIVDDAASLCPQGLTPITPRDPEEILGLLAQAEAKLEATGACVIWLMGSDRLLPSFRLTNPSDDADPIVLSDIPYASVNGAPYSPTRSVARLPEPDGKPEAFIAQILRHADTRHPGPAATAALASGYTASIWRQAAAHVLGQVGSRDALRLSPPWELGDYPFVRSQVAPLRYFNLHGRPEGTTWYGQIDPSRPSSFHEFPAALRQADISAGEARGTVVATEACYGAVLGPRSIATRFLRLGALAFLGSTAMSYGALGKPVSGADILVGTFLREVSLGVPLGQALLHARLAFAQEMMSRQGFLDAEDQKTLLSFHLLGNPLTRMAEPQATAMAAAGLSVPTAPVPVVCAHTLDMGTADVAPGVLAELEQLSEALASESPCTPDRHENCSLKSKDPEGKTGCPAWRAVTLRHNFPDGRQVPARDP